MTIPTQKSGVLGFDTGLNTKKNPLTPSRNFYKFDGWYLSESMSITKRKGFQKVNSVQLVESTTPATFTGLWEFTPSVGNIKQVATTPTGLYVYNTPAANTWNAISLAGVDGTATRTSVDANHAVAIDNLYDASILLDQMYLGNGIDNNIRFDANAATPTAYRMGITAATAACTCTASTTGGSVAGGVYSYKYTYGNALGQESNPSPVSLNVTVSTASTANSVTLSGILNSSDPQVTKKYIYRTTLNGGVWLLLDTINSTSITTYTDTWSDSHLGIAVEGFANGVPPKFSMIDIYRGVAFMAGDPDHLSRVWFSAPNKPACVDSNDFRDLDPNDGDILTGLKRYLTTMVAFKNNSIWNATGDDRSNFGFSRMESAVGSVNNAGIVDVPVKGVLAFMSPNGRFYFYDGVRAMPAAEDIEPTLNALNFSKLKKIVGAVAPAYNQVRWIVPNATDYCDLLIWYDYMLDKWGTTELTTIKANYCASMLDDAQKKQFYMGGVNTGISGGYVWQADTGGADNETNITCVVQDRGHPNQDENPENMKVFSHLFVFFKPTNTTLTVTARLNTPDATPVTLGTIDASQASGTAHIHLNKKARRMFIEITESSPAQGLILRGWQLHYKDVGQHNAP